jgi:hypothetical protein
VELNLNLSTIIGDIIYVIQYSSNIIIFNFLPGKDKLLKILVFKVVQERFVAVVLAEATGLIFNCLICTFELVIDSFDGLNCVHALELMMNAIFVALSTSFE